MIKSGGLSLLEEYGEYTLDYFIKDSNIKDLPILSSFFNVIKVGVGIHDRIFLEKIKSFIENIDNNPKWQDKFRDIEECNKISKQLLYIVDSCDDDNKLKLIGMAFNCLVNGEISRDNYFYTVNIISKSFYPFLKILSDIDDSDERFRNDNTKYDYFGIAHLVNIGALDSSGQTAPTFNPETEEITPPVVIVKVNEYSKFIMELLYKLK